MPLQAANSSAILPVLPTETLRSFDQSLPMALLKAREAVMKKFVPALKAQGLSAQQWRVIRALQHQDGLELSELSTRCYLLMPSLTRIVKNLQARELVVRKIVKADQRRSTLYLSPEGKRLFKLIEPKSAERYDAIAAKFGTDKLEQLYALLDDLVAVLDDGAPD
ncbi:MAG: homoprotocatechuate degradation regulator HpaR [Candidatus Azotimanducaceae bacterium]|jgi:homoprotocatechuate degradation regulator HpaR